jgi:hypothetical protein
VKGHGAITTEDRKTGVDDVRQELQGKMPRGPFEFSSGSDLEFKDLKPSSEDLPPTRTFKQALYRDAKYASANPVFLRAFGLSQAMREIYDGSKQLRDGGIE